ncbi:MAG: S9 family peptidase, partial [Pauljensenia sp.]
MTNPDSLPTPPAWLDEIEGEQALDWVRERNASTEAELAGPHLEHLETRLREVLDAPDRIPFVRVRRSWAYNFWTDADHPRGLWRRQGLDTYLGGGNDWDVLVDVDALSAEEDHSWVWHGANVLHPDGDRALIDLSEGGSDADVTREFDIPSRTWVEGGFTRTRAKGSMSWIDREAVWDSNDFGPGTTSTSGYPLEARLVRRGQDPVIAGAVIR